MILLSRKIFKTRVLLPWMALLALLAACSSDNSPDTGTSRSSESGSGQAAADAGSANRASTGRYDDYRIVTLLPRDAIPAIDSPRFLSAAEADEFYDPDELVLGVEFNGEARAYSVPFLSGHEIVNDTVGGVKIAVTW